MQVEDDWGPVTTPLIPVDPDRQVAFRPWQIPVRNLRDLSRQVLAAGADRPVSISSLLEVERVAGPFSTCYQVKQWLEISGDRHKIAE
jgi:hypothetical protein